MYTIVLHVNLHVNKYLKYNIFKETLDFLFQKLFFHVFLILVNDITIQTLVQTRNSLLITKRNLNFIHLFPFSLIPQ